MIRPSVSRRSLMTATIALLAWTGACSEQEAGINLRKSADERPDVTSETLAQGRITVPGGVAFNLKSFRSEQDQDARGESRAVGTDGAACKAEARNGGSAWGEFLLGYDFDNQTGRVLHAVVRVRLQYTDKIELDAGSLEDDQDPATASTTLVFEIKDTNGVAIRRETLAGSTGLKRARSQAGSREAFFDARFEPGLGYYLAVFGRCQARAAKSGSVSVALEISKYELDIDWQDRRTAVSPAIEASAAPRSATTNASSSSSDHVVP